MTWPTTLGDLFATAFERRVSYRAELTDARPWLYGIAANLVRRHHRAEATRYRALGRVPLAIVALDTSHEAVASADVIAPVRAHLETVYVPLFAAYTTVLRQGDEARSTDLAERLDQAADAESLWTSTLFSKAMDLPSGVFVNEAAGAMAVLSDLWTAVAEAHRERRDHQDI